MKSILCLFLILIFIHCYSQKQNNTWCFGHNAMVDFNNNPPTGNGTSAIFQAEGCASISDHNGQLLFYSDGITVWDRTHQQMPNGFGLLGGYSSTQSSLIVPKPGNIDIYYIFTTPQQSQNFPLAYSIVDMSLNGGMGDITTKNVPIHPPPVAEKLTATLKSNGVDYWVIARESASPNNFVAYSVTSAGVDPTPVVSAITTNLGFLSLGYMKVSPDGSKLAAVQLLEHIVQLFDFNNSTGTVSNLINLDYNNIFNNWPYGVEFSPDNSKLYVLTEQERHLWQFDLLAGSPVAIQNSAVEISNEPSGENGGALLRGPDKKIYIACIGHSYLSVIDQPNLTGAACNFISQAIQLSGICWSGLPNNINYPACPPVTNVSSSITICSNQTYQLPSGTIVSVTGIYQDTIRSMNTCDSIITTVNLSVFPVSYANTSVQICSNQTYQLPSGTIVSVAGIYQDTIRSIGSCDSIITTVNLSTFPVSYVNNSVQICSSQTYQLPSGTVVSAAGIYQDTIRSIGSCDSIITTVNLSIFPVSYVNNSVQICSGQTYQLPSGTLVSAAGIYQDTIRSIVNCDSVITTVNLSVFPISYANNSVQICSHQTYQLPSGAIVSAAGIYQDTVKSIANCDSVITTVNVSVFPVSYVNNSVQICSNQTYHLPSGTIVSTTGVYPDTVRSISSCDSVISIIQLSVNDLSSTNLIDSIFEGEPYVLPWGQTITSPGVYQTVLPNDHGCDSLITVTVKWKTSLFNCLTLKNAFTPNADGINDYWVLSRYRCFRKMEVNVYNRYGSKVYYSGDYNNDWNGNYRNKALPDATYYYIIKIFAFDGREYFYKGNVTILR